jgi:hypothetical protein
LTWFLRLFSQFRLLEQSVAQAESARIQADDNARLWRAKADWAEAERDKARSELSAAIKNTANWEAVMMGAPQVPFPEVYTAPPPPPAGQVGPQPVHRATLRDLQRDRVMASRQAAHERMMAAKAATE